MKLCFLLEYSFLDLGVLTLLQINAPPIMLLICICDFYALIFSLLSGTSDMALLFYLGLTMGIISSFLANKQEVEKLKNLLKQTENLVQDLQEELEMKDSLTVKELAAEDYELQDVHNDRCFDDAVYSLSLEQNFNEEYCDQKAEEKSLSKIEEELEAELQRLESNMNSSSLEGKLCSLTEVSIFVCACFFLALMVIVIKIMGEIS